MATKKKAAPKRKAVKPEKLNRDIDAVITKLQTAKANAAKAFMKTPVKLAGVRVTLLSAATKLESIISEAHGSDFPDDKG